MGRPAAYLVAALGTLAAFAIRLALAEYLDPPFLLFYPVVVLAAILGGLGPGIFSTLLSTALSALWILPEEHPGTRWATRDLASLGVFTLVSIFLSFVADRYRASLRRIRALEVEQSEATVRLSQERLDLALGAGKLGLWDLDFATGQAWRTLQHDRIFGYDELQPRWGVDEALRHVVEEDRPLFHRAFEEAMATGHFHYELRIQPSGLPLRWIAADGEVFQDAAGKPIRMRGTVVDVTEHKEMEARAAQAERQAAVTTLVRGMSHEINSPLASVVANLDYAREQLASAPSRAAEAWSDQGHPPLAELGEALADAAASADRIKVIVKDMTTFLPRGRPAARHAGAGPVLEEALELAAAELRPCEAVTVDLPELPDVAVGREDLLQVFFSLLANAGQATGSGPNRIRVTGERSGPDKVTFTISDTGAGMSPFVLDHVFEPFFTTRGVGRGKGLGLPLCRGVVDSAGGALTLRSEVDKGTTVTLTLPAFVAAGP